MCKDLEIICEVWVHSLCEECEWCPCIKDPHNCDTFFEEAYRNGFGG